MKRNHKWLRCATACLLVFMLMNCSVSSAGLAASDESPGTTYSVGTQAEDYSVPADNSAASLSASSTSVAAPSSVNAVAVSRTSIQISWSASSNADAYFLKRYNPATDQWDIIAQTFGLSFTDNNCVADTAYRYHVVAYKTIDGLVYFAPVSVEATATTPLYAYAPTWVNASPKSSTSIEISWSAAAGADAYFLKRYNTSTPRRTSSIPRRPPRTW